MLPLVSPRLFTSKAPPSAPINDLIAIPGFSKYSPGGSQLQSGWLARKTHPAHSSA